MRFNDEKQVQCYNVVRSLLLCRFIAVVGAMVAVAAIAAVAVAVATAPIQLFNFNSIQIPQLNLIVIPAVCPCQGVGV